MDGSALSENADLLTRRTRCAEGVAKSRRCHAGESAWPYYSGADACRALCALRLVPFVHILRLMATQIAATWSARSAVGAASRGACQRV